jgi:hypothetical protein
MKEEWTDLMDVTVIVVFAIFMVLLADWLISTSLYDRSDDVCENTKIEETRVLGTTFGKLDEMEIVTDKGSFIISGRHSFGTDTRYCSNGIRSTITTLNNDIIRIK